MGISDRMDALGSYSGSSPCPLDFERFWQAQALGAAAPQKPYLQQIALPNPAARYYEVRFSGTDGAPLYARYIRPAGSGPFPTVLLFHDYGRGIRGWHHMTRFAALGWAVVALENRVPCCDITAGWRAAPEGLSLVQLYTDALTLAHLARALPGVDAARLAPWGEGLGGGLALAAAALLPEYVTKCAALNPLPADPRRAWALGCDGGLWSGLRACLRDHDPTHAEAEELFLSLGYLDCARFAPMLRCRLLLGTGLMDRLSPPDGQYAVFHAASCEKRHIVYPNYEHERINFFKNELLTFLYN